MRTWSCSAVILAICLASISCRLPWPPIANEFDSPNKTYTIRLRGHTSAPQSPFFVHPMYLDAFSRGTPLVVGHEIHFADWFDTSFEDMYSGHEWLSESVLRLRSPGGLERDERSEISVENHSSRTVRLLKVQANDLFVLLELAPGSQTRLLAWHRNDACWIDVTGVWADGSSMRGHGANFWHTFSETRHRVVIDEDGAQIR